MSHGSHDSHGDSAGKKVLKVIGIGIRLALDVVVTAIVCFVFWKGGMDLDSFQNTYSRTMYGTAQGFAKVLTAVWYMNPTAVALAVLDNLWSWQTFTFVLETGVVLFITFWAYVLWRSWWLGGSFLLLGLLSLAWLFTMWGMQLFGPLVIPLVITVLAANVGTRTLWWLVKKLWSLAEDEAAH